MELRILAVLTRFLHGSELLHDYYNGLLSRGGRLESRAGSGEKAPAPPSQLQAIWAHVVKYREFLRGKRQEFTSQQSSGGGGA